MIDFTDLTIIIPTLNWIVGSSKQIDYALANCLQSLTETIPGITRVIIASNSGDSKPLPNFNGVLNYSRINLWEQGQCKAVNAAAATVNTKWVMVANDDMVFPPGWTIKMGLQLDEDYDCISPILVEPRPGAPTFLADPLGGAGGDFNYRAFVDKYRNYAGIGLGVRNGFNLPYIMKREVWKLVDGYDVNYDPWGSNSDSDLEYKLKLAGIQPKQNTNCAVYHFSQTSGTFHPSRHNFWQRNYDYFTQKWGFKRADSPDIWTAEFTIPEKELKYKPKWASNEYLS